MHPPTSKAPLTTATPTNQSAPIAILSAFTLALVLLSLLTHLYARRRSAPHRASTLAFYGAVALGLAHAGVVLYLVSVGLGRDVVLLLAGVGSTDADADGSGSESADETLQKLNTGIRASEALYLCALGASKISCGCMLGWLTPFTAQKRAAWVLVAASAVWMVCGAGLCGAGCVRFGDGRVDGGGGGECVGYEARWIGVSVVDMLLEAALVGGSVCMVWGRSMSYRAKATVVGAFSCRLPNIALTLARILFQLLPAPTSAVFTARVQATMQLAVGYTVVACVIPYLRPLMQSYEDDGAGSANSSGDATFVLSERSRSSKGSGSGSGDMVGDKGKGRAGGMELDDVSNFLEVKRPALVRLMSREPVVSSVAGTA